MMRFKDLVWRVREEMWIRRHFRREEWYRTLLTLFKRCIKHGLHHTALRDKLVLICIVVAFKMIDDFAYPMSNASILEQLVPLHDRKSVRTSEEYKILERIDWHVYA